MEFLENIDTYMILWIPFIEFVRDNSSIISFAPPMVTEKVGMQFPVFLHGETNLFDIGRSVGYRLMAPPKIVFVDCYKDEIYLGVRLDGGEEIG